MSPEARARVNARHAEHARKRARALVEDSLWLLEVGGCSFAEIVARTGHRTVASYAAALRRAGRLDVLYRVRRDHAALAEWRAERERKWRRRYEEANREARRAANRERMRRVRAEARAVREWEQKKVALRRDRLLSERYDLASVGVEAEAVGRELADPLGAAVHVLAGLLADADAAEAAAWINEEAS
jgi:hypothetical protein